VVIIDEYQGSIPGGKLLQLLDGYPQMVITGQSDEVRAFNPDGVVITSQRAPYYVNHDSQGWYADKRECDDDALMRRCVEEYEVKLHPDFKSSDPEAAKYAIWICRKGNGKYFDAWQKNHVHKDSFIQMLKAGYTNDQWLACVELSSRRRHRHDLGCGGHGQVELCFYPVQERVHVSEFGK
jgi:hypothetical protein